MDILHEIRIICSDAAFREEIIDLLQQLCAIDTCPGPDLARLRENEQRTFEVIRAALEDLRLPGVSIVQKEVSPSVQSHPAFSRPYYATGSVEEVYRGRSNLLYLLDREPSAAGGSVALNAHIDVVPPFFPPVRAGDFVAGRGTADDKGNVAAIVGALQVLAELERRGVVRLKNQLTAMFVIDEETGGNGSLDLAMDRKLKERYDSILVMECTGNRLHPANRGAVFIRCEGHLANEQAPEQVTPSLIEAFALAILALLDEGEAIRQESDHPLFPHRPVQTCTGILGPFGVHPSAICGEVAFTLVFPAAEGPSAHGPLASPHRKTGESAPQPPQPWGEDADSPRPWGEDADSPRSRGAGGAVFSAEPHRKTGESAPLPPQPWGEDADSPRSRGAGGAVFSAEPPTEEVLLTIIDRGIARYVVRYGDKTQVVDPTTGARKVERHYDIAWQNADRCTVTIHGATGHMGSLPQNDAAIAKWAYVMRELIDARRAQGLAFTLAWPGADPQEPACLIFEGAQGFLPTHSLEEVKARSRNAFLTAIQRYLTDEGLPPESITCDVSFDKLHNDAFAGDPSSESLLRALRTAVDVGLAQPDEPMRGWEVSCDARLFAGEYPGLPVLTFGAGQLEHAHSDRERIHVADLIDSIAFVALFVLRETGMIP